MSASTITHPVTAAPSRSTGWRLPRCALTALTDGLRVPAQAYQDGSAGVGFLIDIGDSPWCMEGTMSSDSTKAHAFGGYPDGTGCAPQRRPLTTASPEANHQRPLSQITEALSAPENTPISGIQAASAARPGVDVAADVRRLLVHAHHQLAPCQR
ncbi:hypothetical protein [Streptomyces sp. NPDC002671]